MSVYRLLFSAGSFGLAGIQMPGVLNNNVLSWGALFFCAATGVLHLIAAVQESRYVK